MIDKSLFCGAFIVCSFNMSMSRLPLVYYCEMSLSLAADCLRTVLGAGTFGILPKVPIITICRPNDYDWRIFIDSIHVIPLFFLRPKRV